MLETATSSLSFNAPFGTWPKDFDWESIRPPAGSSTYLSLSHSGRVDIFPNHGVVTKLYWDSAATVERIWNLMQLAGNCSVSLVGRLFLEPGSTQVHGYTMPIETPIDTENFGTKNERIRLIYQLRDLLANLHSKNIVHGDIKPPNVLICSDGHPRFCDFDNASVEGDGFVATSMTYPYCSTFRGRNETLPMTRAEDMHAMAMTMWEIYTGIKPLVLRGEDYEDVKFGLMDRCLVGFLPEMELIDDPEVASLIATFIAAGPERPDVLERAPVYCVETRFVLGNCKAEPTKHTYSRIIHSWGCLERTDRGDGPCEYPFVDPKVFTTPLEPICVKCNEGVNYIGLGQ